MHSKSVHSKICTASFSTEADGITLDIGEDGGLAAMGFRHAQNSFGHGQGFKPGLNPCPKAQKGPKLNTSKIQNNFNYYLLKIA